jgi:hypothetical protein
MTHIDKDMMEAWDKDPNIGKALKSPQQGAATTVWAATAKALEGQGGKYLEECQISSVVNSDAASNEPGYSLLMRMMRRRRRRCGKSLWSW